jgi:hypothetical protein
MLETLQQTIEVTCIEMICRGGILGSQKPAWIDGDYKTLTRIKQCLSGLVLDSLENDGLVGYKCWIDTTTGTHSLGVQEIYYDQEHISWLSKFSKRKELVRKIDLDGESELMLFKVRVAALLSGYKHYPYSFPRRITNMLEKSLFHNRILTSTDRTILLQKLKPVFPEIQFNLVEVISIGDIAF